MRRVAVRSRRPPRRDASRLLLGIAGLTVALLGALLGVTLLRRLPVRLRGEIRVWLGRRRESAAASVLQHGLESRRRQPPFQEPLPQQPASASSASDDTEVHHQQRNDRDRQQRKLRAWRRHANFEQSAGPVCRWRSFSDFLSASRMKDMVSRRVPKSVRRRGASRPGDRAGEHDLGLDAGDTVYGELIPPLEVHHLPAEIRIENVARLRSCGAATDAAAEPARSQRTSEPRIPRTAASRFAWPDARASRSRRTSSARAHRFRSRAACRRGTPCRARRSRFVRTIWCEFP